MKKRTETNGDMAKVNLKRSDEHGTSWSVHRIKESLESPFSSRLSSLVPIFVKRP